jgi:peptidoglycan/LPS O-acetylase OafA/YrhL
MAFRGVDRPASRFFSRFKGGKLGHFFRKLRGICLFNRSGVAIPFREYLNHIIPGYWRLSSSERFLTDYAVGLLVALNFASFQAIQGYFSTVLRASAPVIRFFAGYTFSLYLYHYPMMAFCEKIFPNTANSWSFYMLTMIVIFGLCLLLGHFTERQKWVVRAFVVGVANMAARSGGRVKSPASAT